MIKDLLPEQLNIEATYEQKINARWQAESHLLAGDTPAAMIEALGSTDEAAAILGALALIRSGDQVVPALLRALGDSNVWLRRRAVWPLRMIGSTRAVDALIAALLYDEDEKVRRYAAWALGILGGKRAVNPLIRAFSDSDERVRWDAAVALEKIGLPAIKPLIMALYYGGPETRMGAISALAWMRHPSAARMLVVALRDKNTAVRTHAALALGWLGDSRAVPPLIRVLKDRRPEVRMQAALALGWIGDPAAIDALVDLMGEDHQWVPVTAVDALSHINHPRAREALMIACSYGNPQVRTGARRALARLGVELEPSPPPDRPAWMFKKRSTNEHPRTSDLTMSV